MAKPLQARFIAQPLFRKNMLLKAIGFLIALILLMCLFPSNLAAQTIIISKNDGNWNSTSTWDSGTVPTTSDNVTVDNVNGNSTITVAVQSGTTAEVNDLIIGQYGKLIVEGTLIVYGNLTMANNDPELIAGSDATIIIHGNAEISNKVNINLSSYFIILGNFTIKGGGDTDINISDASIYVFGTFDGGSTDLKLCEDYDNNTEDYNPDSCHVGTDSAFYDNDDDGLIPDEITDLVDPCYSPSITLNPSTSDQNYCLKESSDSLTVSALGDGLTYQWYSNTSSSNSGGTELTGETDTIFTPSTANEGTLYFYCVVNGDCGADTSSVSGLITLFDLPNNTLGGFSDSTICAGEDGILTFNALNFTFDAPYTIEYTDGSSTWQQEITSDADYEFNVAVDPTSTTTYSLVSITNGNGCIRTSGFGDATAQITVNQFNIVVSDETPTSSGNHCPEFGGPFNANTASYNPGVTEVVFKVKKGLSASTEWIFDFEVNETGDVQVYDLVASGNNSAISYTGDDAAGSIDATNNTEVTFTFQIWNVPGTALDVDFSVSNGNDGNCDETGTLSDNSKTHRINAMPLVGTFNP